MITWLVKRKWLLVNIFLVALLLSLTGVQVADRGSTPNRVLFGVGDEKVITLGHIAYAAGSVDYTYDGTDDNVQFQAALNALPATGGRLVDVSAVQKNFSVTVTRAIPNVTIEGSGAGSYFVNDGGTALFTAGGNNWVFQNLRTDAGNISMGATTGWMWTNITVAATYHAYRSPYGASSFNDTTVASLTDSGLTSGRIPIAGVGGLLSDSLDLTFSGSTLTATAIDTPTGRGATITVAASDATALEISQADYIVSGTATDELIAAIAAAGVGGHIRLSSGNFSMAASGIGDGNASCVFLLDYQWLQGSGKYSTKLNLVNGAQENVIGVLNKTGVCISDLEINANKTGNTETGPMNDGKQNAIYFTGVSKSTVNNCYTHDAIFHGIFNVSGNYNRFTNNDVYANRARPIHAQQASYNYYGQNYIHGNGTDDAVHVGGLFVIYAGACDGNIIEGNIIKDELLGAGIYVGGTNASDGNLIVGNTIVMSDADVTGINFNKGADASSAVGTIVSGNTIIAGRHGISFENGSFTATTIADNYIYGTGGRAIYAVNSQIRLRITGNYLRADSEESIYLFGGSSSSIISNNFIQAHDTYAGIRLKSTTYTIISDNQFNDCKWSVDEVTDGGNSSNTIIDNIETTIAQTPSMNTASINVRGNTYIRSGEIRTYTGSIATLTENAFNSKDNPFGQAVRLLSLEVYVSTNATATAPNIDCGIGSSATTDYTTLFDDLPGETIGFYTSTVTTPGTQTVPQLWASGSGNRYLNLSIKGAAATGMVATYTVTVMGN